MCCAHRIVASTLRRLMRTSAHSDTLHSHTLIPLQNYQSKSLEIFLADRGTIPSKCCVLLQQQQLCLKKDQLLPSKQQALAVSTMRPCLWHQVWQPACMKLGSKPPRTSCSILCNLSSVTRCTRQPAGSMHKCEPESSNPEIEPSWKRREGCCSRGGSSWRQRRRAALDVGSREEPRRYATVLREVAGQDPPAV